MPSINLPPYIETKSYGCSKTPLSSASLLSSAVSVYVAFRQAGGGVQAAPKYGDELTLD